MGMPNGFCACETHCGSTRISRVLFISSLTKLIPVTRCDSQQTVELQTLARNLHSIDPSNKHHFYFVAFFKGNITWLSI